MSATREEVYNGVSTADEPSAAWGWHNLGTKAVQTYGWISVAVLLLLNFGNHQGHVETLWLVGLAVVIALLLVLQLLQPRFKQSRTVTARNKPAGHQEIDWPRAQLELSGPYADLTDSQLRSLNIDPTRLDRDPAKRLEAK